MYLYNRAWKYNFFLNSRGLVGSSFILGSIHENKGSSSPRAKTNIHHSLIIAILEAIPDSRGNFFQF
jgi:hypothetical protein